MFTGYTDQTVDVFWGIRFNNDRAWFAEHKQEFQDAVMTPTKALAGELYDWFQETYPDLHLNVHISRIYRDARRLFGRGPLNDHIWFSFQNAIENRGEAPCFWFQVGADGYRAQLLPEQKAEAVLKLQVQGNGVVMVGDGINDAPALAYADVGISMGSKSTDIAMETSDVIINRDDPMMIPELRRLSRATMRIVHQNFALVVAINSVGLILGAASGISVMMSALLHNSSTILVVANSLRLMFMKPKDGRA